MKLELVGDYCSTRSTWSKDKAFYTWTLWLTKDYKVAYGRAETKKQAREAAKKAWIKFQSDICALRVPPFQEWE